MFLLAEIITPHNTRAIRMFSEANIINTLPRPVEPADFVGSISSNTVPEVIVIK